MAWGGQSGGGVVFVALLLLIFAPIHAQEDAPLLIPDEPQTVTLSAEAPVVLHYEAEGGEVVTIIAEAMADDESRPDTVLALIAPDDTQMAYNDNTRSEDDGLLTDAQLQNVRLPVAGTYRVVVDSFNGVTEGEAEVRLTQVDPFAVQVEDSDDGQVVRFVLPMDVAFSFAFTVAAGSRWTITARDTAGSRDPYLRVLDEEGAEITRNDDHGTPNLGLDVFDAQINGWVAPQDGTYTVQVSDVLGCPGEFVLTILPLD